MSGYRLGPIGALREIPPVAQAGTPVTNERASSSWTTLGGNRIVQRAPRALRTWSLDLGQWRAPADVAYLTALATGALPGPLYLYTDAAAQTNLLPAGLAAPASAGSAGYVIPPSSPLTVSVDLPGMPGVTLGAAARGSLLPDIPIPVLPSTQYVFSCWSSGSGSAGRVRTYTAAGVLVATHDVASGTGRRQVAFTTGATVAYVTITAPGSGAVSGLRLTQGATQDPVWLPGQGVPQVVVSDPEQVIQVVTADRVASDYTVTIQEVG